MENINKPSALRKLNEQWLRERPVDASAPPVLIADDSEADIYFLLRAFEKSGVKNPITVARSGEETVDYLNGSKKLADRGSGSGPKIIFLDLYMPVVSGFDVLQWKADHPEFKGALFIALSNSDRLKDINRAYELGASTFLSKPLDRTEVVNLLEAYQDFWSLDESAASETGRLQQGDEQSSLH